ncbi:carbamoyl-phosphate synthase large subunit [Kineosphaera limosa]|uniref:Carbamoyl phosphate synthase large chain n=1 Tax=Kineosphaera limosa NBRC 100340 TaxID=1184609 RepID=K6WW78_9MICO|nr:carbamoyl-phosphate synthase large subunit [Kineosphaera limosa]NYD99158.1 carbamoyl-phosphate synthase large subunit [Kineosphaera limosa]GAB96322.1 carbamoyl-phosphate synthase large chain [Kineosphaera limosa NBRC 100340]
MPKRTDIASVLVIGSGPIVIGQAAEFDYSGTQACRVLREEGLRVILVNSNPATIMTDPEIADATYVEPITPGVLEAIIAKERPDAVLATLGGQTALNAAMALHEAGTLAKYGCPLIGASVEAIQLGENREQFKGVVERCGAESARSVICHTMDELLAGAADLGYPVVVRPSFTMGGLGSGFAYDEDDLRRIGGAGLHDSPVTEVLLEESILGWKEYELEVMRDHADNVVVVCSIENVDPVGVHTGDSITVAPALTLTDREYQKLRDIGIAVIREVGVDTGGCNIQFAVNPVDGRIIVIEMNPRVSRSSALASKATGFPIAKIAAKMAIGYTLDEVPNDITTRGAAPPVDPPTGSELAALARSDVPTNQARFARDSSGGAWYPAAFEPTLDYVVVKVPRFAFEKFPAADPTLTTTMKSVGEAMAIGRNFTEALQKALRSIEQKGAGFHWDAETKPSKELARALLQQAMTPTDGRIVLVQQALRGGLSVEAVHEATGIDPWFLDQIQLLNDVAKAVQVSSGHGRAVSPQALRLAKRHGFSDAQIGQLIGAPEAVVRGVRHALGVRPVYKTVDTCAAEFAASTPYYYSSYDEETEVARRQRPAVIILGSGPNRIGQGIEFDYSCVHASFALREVGFDTIMVNCNPETVSTDYDTSSRLYFEPLTLEDVLEVVHAEMAAGPVAGVVVQLGGQTPLGLAQALKDEGVPIVGTSPEAIDLAEDRGHFGRVLAEADLPAPKHGIAYSADEAVGVADSIGYPVLVRPSYVLGGRGMEIVYDEKTLRTYVERATHASPEHPVLVDRFLDDAIEIDVDVLFDGVDLYVGGIMEHIEEAGIHSGDSACVIPPVTLGPGEVERVRESSRRLAEGIGVHGLMNVQFALAQDVLYVLEANPRASRTVPFVAKATGVPLAKAAARVMLGASIAQLRAEGLLPATGDGGELPVDAPVSVKEAILPFKRFRTADGRVVDSVLGPEMRSTGEVMGIDDTFGPAFAKTQMGALSGLPVAGRIFVSVANRDKRAMVFPIKVLADLGFELLATKGTAQVLRRNGVQATVVRKHSEGAGPHGEPTIVEEILAGTVDMVVNTPGSSDARRDGYAIRTATTSMDRPIITTVQQLAAAVQGIEALRRGPLQVASLQEHAARLAAGRQAGGLPDAAADAQYA